MRKQRFFSCLFSLVMTAALMAWLLPGQIVTRAAAADSGVIQFQSAMNYGGAFTDAFQDVAFTSDGGFVAVGYTFSDGVRPEWTLQDPSHNYEDGLIIKFDKDHKVQWAKTIDMDASKNSYDVLYGVDILKNGRIAVAGTVPFTSADGTSIKGTAMYVGIFNPDNPDDYRAYHIGGASGDQGFSVAGTSDGGFVVGGWSASTTGYYVTTTDEESYSEPVQLWEAVEGTDESLPNRCFKSGSDSVIVRFDADGNLRFTALENYAALTGEYNISSPSQRFDDLEVDQNDNIVLVGYNTISKNAQNAVIAKVDGKTGRLLWHKSAGYANSKVVPTKPSEYIKAEYRTVTVLTDGSLIAAGTATNAAATEEAWDITGEKDTIVVHYAADGTLIHADSFGTAGDSDSRMEGVTATGDGGYILFGSQSGVIGEDSQLAKGYDWGNYGGNDGILIKYDENDKVVWSENYGSRGGDWINGLDIKGNGEIIAVGESNGTYGKPAWYNEGKIDAVVMSSEMYPAAYTEIPSAAKDGNIVWKDGMYTDSGEGYAGPGSVTLDVRVEDHKIISITKNKTSDTPVYYDQAESLYYDIQEAQAADVDAVSGATYSSNGIKEAVSKCLSQAAAGTVVDSVNAFGSVTDADAADSEKRVLVETAISQYEELGTYAQKYVTNYSMLEAAAAVYDLAINGKIPSDSEDYLPKTKPAVAAAGGTYNDPYWKQQSVYLNGIHATVLREKKLTGKGVKIAIVDSGLMDGHRDLDYSRVLDGYDYINDVKLTKENLEDTNGHGTAVAGILMATPNNNIGIVGLLDDVEIVPLRVNPKKSRNTDEESQRANAESSRQIGRVIRDAVDTYHVDVITTSLDVADSDELKAAVDYAASKNVIIVGAAGNTGTKAGNDEYIYPASYDNVISVGAVDQKNKVRSNSQKNDQVYVTAPGENIAVLSHTGAAKCNISSGTSYSSPVVAAMAAAAKQIRPDLTVDQFKALLRTSSSDAGEKGYDISYGYGIVDMRAFANRLLPEQNTTMDKTPANKAAADNSATTAVKTGTEFKRGRLTYKVTSAKAVTLINADKSLAKISVPAKVKYNGKSYAVTRIGAKAFYKNKKLKSVTIGANVTKIGNNAFAGCRKLKSVIIGKKVKSIGKKAFYKDTGLKKVIFKGTALKSVGSKAFQDIHKKVVFKGPKKVLNRYKRLISKKGKAPAKAKYKKNK